MKFSTFVIQGTKRLIKFAKVSFIAAALALSAAICGTLPPPPPPPPGATATTTTSDLSVPHYRPRTLNDMEQEIKEGYDPFAHWDDRYNPIHLPI